ncbi:MAG TPA: sensor histidine kinase [Ktedonobacteraceae bacterium]|nr:sensor histidine kinase [Ktedonobacteraceae bacterium]
MQRQNIIHTEASTTIAIQLASSSLLTGGVALLMFYWLNSLGLTSTIAIILALACSVGAGLLATANIQYGVFLLYLNLTRLAEGRPASIQLSFWLWPLSALFHSLIQANLKIDEIFQRERLANEYREQLLQQTSKAAAAEERNHLARDLHDSIKQQIFSIRMSAIAAKGHVQIGVTKAQEALEDILKSANEAQVEMQALLQQLRSTPLENMGLAEAIQTQAQALEYRSGAQVSVAMDELPAAERCSPHMQEALFRIVQEAFANIARHARAQHVWYTQTQNEQTLLVTIQDDGQGFDIQAVRKGMGLTNIQERALSLDGSAKIESEIGKGTILHIQLPLTLLPETRQEQEQEEYEAQRMVARAHGGLQLHSTILAFTLVVLVTNLGLFAARISTGTKELFMLILGLCVFLMCYGLISAHLAIARLKQYRDEGDRGLRELSLKMHFGWVSFLRTFFFVSWQFLLWELTLLWQIPWWACGLLFLLVAGSITIPLLLERRQARHAQNRYYPLLSGTLLRWEIHDRWRSLRLRIILSLCFAITLLLNHTMPFLLPVMPWQWLVDYVLFAFFILGIGIVIDIRELRRWGKQTKIVSKNL